MRVLMCEPKYFDVPFEDKEKNPWMNVLRKPDNHLAHCQWQELCDFYRKQDIGISYLIPKDGSLFDQVFTANLAFGIGDKWVIGNLAPWWRKLETVYVAEFLARERKSISYLPERMVFEGQGDLVRIGSREYCYCWGIRNSCDARWPLEYAFPHITKIPMRLCDPRWYHGDMCIRYLAACNTILWIPQAFDRQSRKRLLQYAKYAGIQMLSAPKRLWFQETKQGINFPMNGVNVGTIETFPWDEKTGRFPKKIREYIENKDGTLWLHNADQFGLSGAGHRCMTLVLEP